MGTGLLLCMLKSFPYNQGTPVMVKNHSFGVTPELDPYISSCELEPCLLVCASVFSLKPQYPPVSFHLRAVCSKIKYL